MTRRLRLIVLAALLLETAAVVPAEAYLKFGVRIGERPVALTWRSGLVRYRVSERGVPGVSAPQLRDAVAKAFASWEAVPSASIAYRFEGFTQAVPGEEDGLSTLGFVERRDLDRVLASTSFLIDMATGELLESDIYFNGAFSWSVAEAGERNRFDLESIALHEIGHLSGLGHSALGETELNQSGRRVVGAESVMFPIAFGAGTVEGRRLRADDVAGISDLYPDGGFTRRTGSLSGRVTGSGRGLFGAHVIAFDIATGSMIGGFTLSTEGRFSIAGLTPGPHLIRIEPLDDADTESFFEASSPVALDFRVTYHRHLVVVPEGGDSGTFEVAVAPK